MTHRRTTKFWIESLVAGAGGLLCLVTLISREWIELIFGVDPDHGSGALEWAIVGGLFAVSLVSAVLARLECRHTSTLAVPVQRE
jgi:hypothetical protein